MNRIELIYKRPTRRISHNTLGHTQVILNNKPIGYFLPQNAIRKGDYYHLTIDELEGDYIAEYFPSRKHIIKFLQERFNPVLLLDRENIYKNRQ